MGFGPSQATGLGFPGNSDGKESACNVGDLGSIPGLGKPLEKGMKTHCSILAWRTPWTDEPAGSERVRHDRDDHSHLEAASLIRTPLHTIHIAR